MKIEGTNFFHTPKDMKELQDWLSNLNGSESLVATTAAMMAWNLAAKVTNEEETE
jgi:Tfp pilus assembly protein PilN